MTDDFLAALALVLVIEGLLPFIVPHLARTAWQRMAALSDRDLRITGLIGMVLGLVMLYLIR